MSAVDAAWQRLKAATAPAAMAGSRLSAASAAAPPAQPRGDGGGSAIAAALDGGAAGSADLASWVWDLGLRPLPHSAPDSDAAGSDARGERSGGKAAGGAEGALGSAERGGAGQAEGRGDDGVREGGNMEVDEGNGRRSGEGNKEGDVARENTTAAAAAGAERAAAAAAALRATQAAAGGAVVDDSKVQVREVVDFAGEAVEVVRVLDARSKEAAAAKRKADMQVRERGKRKVRGERKCNEAASAAWGKAGERPCSTVVACPSLMLSRVLSLCCSTPRLHSTSSLSPSWPHPSSFSLPSPPSPVTALSPSPAWLAGVDIEGVGRHIGADGEEEETQLNILDKSLLLHNPSLHPLSPLSALSCPPHGWQASTSKGLDAILAQMEKKKKLNILDKSRKVSEPCKVCARAENGQVTQGLERAQGGSGCGSAVGAVQHWPLAPSHSIPPFPNLPVLCCPPELDEYKEGTGVVEELEEYRRSGATYTEKRAFLGQADLREYERERDAKLAAQARRARPGGVD
ncbi:unnamed protein product [Closterium sp. Naga37s-1]|nr:unnamed protein product [Closterium sp. Naga37s-1]